MHRRSLAVNTAADRDLAAGAVSHILRLVDDGGNAPPPRGGAPAPGPSTHPALGPRRGTLADRPIDVRLVAARNRSLDDEVRAGRFGQDLYSRLSAAPVVLPPLRDRRSDITTLARQFLAEACLQVHRDPMSITSAAMQALL